MTMATNNPLISAAKFLLREAEAFASPYEFAKLLDAAAVDSRLAKAWACSAVLLKNGEWNLVPGHDYVKRLLFSDFDNCAFIKKSVLKNPFQNVNPSVRNPFQISNPCVGKEPFRGATSTLPWLWRATLPYQNGHARRSS